jgi:hypothetical protein
MKKIQRWLRSRQGLISIIGAIVLILAVGVVGQLGGWWNLVPGAGTVIRPVAAWDVPGGGYTCLPSCDETDGKFLIMASDGLRTFAAEPLIVWIGVPETQATFELGIFDGDTGRDNTGALNPRNGNWDQGTSESTYTLYVDPLKNGAGSQVVGQWKGNTDGMPNNDWFDITLNHLSEAQAPSGHYYYRLEVTHPFDAPRSANGFKLRTTGYISAGLSDRVDATIGLAGMLTTQSDLSILYPQFVNYSNLGPSTYTGDWVFHFYLPNNVEVLEVWDGDFDHGSWDGSTLDIDDPVTGTGYVPEWANSPAVVPQGAQGIGAPPDDYNTPSFRRSPAVVYTIIDPVGDPIHTNPNPSGSEEWQRFVISTDPNQLAHYYVDELKPGRYGWHIQGLDLHNFVWIRTIYEILGECANPEDCLPPPPEWPEGACPRTIGYWKTNASKLLSPRPRGVQESVETYEWVLRNIALEGASAFYRNADGSPLTLQQANDILWPQTPATMETRARQQLLATWLNVGSGKLGPTTVVELHVPSGTFNGTIMEAIREAEAQIAAGNFERAKDIADLINNGELNFDEDVEMRPCTDYVQVIPPGKQPPPREEMPEAPTPDIPDTVEPDPEPDPATCPNLRVNQYNVENMTDNPFYGIKFEYQSGTEVKDGNFDQFKFVVAGAQAAQMNDTGVRVEAKAGTLEGEAILVTCQFDQGLPCGEVAKDPNNYFAFYFLGAADNGDGTLTLTFQVQNLTSLALSHATIGLPAGTTPSSPTNNYQSEVCQ